MSNLAELQRQLSRLERLMGQVKWKFDLEEMTDFLAAHHEVRPVITKLCRLLMNMDRQDQMIFLRMLADGRPLKIEVTA